MSVVIGAFLRAECGHKGTDLARETRNGLLGRFSYVRLAARFAHPNIPGNPDSTQPKLALVLRHGDFDRLV